MVGAAAWQLKNEFAEVEIAAWSTGWVQGRSSRETKSKGKKSHLRLVGEHYDCGKKVGLSKNGV
jgi:hypothetical protein